MSCSQQPVYGADGPDGPSHHHAGLVKAAKLVVTNGRARRDSIWTEAVPRHAVSFRLTTTITETSINQGIFFN